MIALFASFLIATNAPAAELVKSARELLPREVTLEGRLVKRSRRGIVQDAYDYVLTRTNGVTELKLFKDGSAVAFAKEGAICGTDVTWSDVTLDYLWWDDFADDEQCERESIHGQKCRVILMRKGERTVRVWIDPKTGAMLEAEEVASGASVRRLWGTRLKKFGERWMASQMEVETLGSGHRTKITVEKFK